MTRADDPAHLGTPRQLHDGRRFDYDGTPFSRSDQSSYVVRFRTDEPRFEVPRNSDIGGNGTYGSWRDPFTGNGFTKATEDLVPEWQVPCHVTVQMEDGAAMWEVLDTGAQELTAVLRAGVSGCG